MKREDFKKIIRLRSIWQIDRRKGDYKLLSNENLSDYVMKLVISQMKLDNIAIRNNGDLCDCSGGNWNSKTKNFDDYVLFPPFGKNEVCSYDEMERRIKELAFEIVR